MTAKLKAWCLVCLMGYPLLGAAKHVVGQIHNVSPWILRDPIHQDGRGRMVQLNVSEVPAYDHALQAFEMATNLWGNMDQTLRYQLFSRAGELMGYCDFQMHLQGLGAALDPRGSLCILQDRPADGASAGNVALDVELGPEQHGAYVINYRLDTVKTFSRLIVFGDSLSDVGNLFTTTGKWFPKSPPYDRGRFTNGPVWVELLQEQLGIDDANHWNYAYGGAQTQLLSNIVPSLDIQVERFLNVYPEPDPFALYVVWAGANDFTHAVSDPELETDASVEHIRSVLDSLLRAGARFVLVPTMADLGDTPDARDSDARAGDHAASQVWHTVTQLFNDKLTHMLNALQATYPRARMLRFDTLGFFKTIRAQASSLGLTDLEHACNPNNYLSHAQPVCHQPDTYLFWDNIHPSARVHGFFAQAVASFLQQEGFGPNVPDTHWHRGLRGMPLVQRNPLQWVLPSGYVPSVMGGSAGQDDVS